ncbi:MAG: Abi family protein, partial [Lachnospiraceae bacterium]|nr:Abi family protein [Lachnospiraceae bacterium]
LSFVYVLSLFFVHTLNCKNTQTKKYYTLDFAYLVELSKIDMYIRRIILELCLDVEHYLKVRLIYDLSNNLNEDGYNIVRLFLQYHPNAEADIRNKADKYSFCSDLAEKHLNEYKEPNQLALWNIVELLSFGNFMELYELYYQTYPSFNYSDYLKSIKFIRNAAAHNNCILSTLRKPNSVKKFSKTKKLANILGKIPEFRELDCKDAMMKNPVVHDFVALLFVYNDIMKVSATKNIRNKKMQEICFQFCDENGRIRKNKSYFDKNPCIKETYSFICSIIKYIDKKNKNPKHTNFL